MVQTFKFTLEDMEVRKCEEVETAIGDNVYRSLSVNFDTKDGDRLIFKDRDVNNKDKYQRGHIGTLEITVSTDNVIKTSKSGSPYTTEKTTLLIHDFKEGGR
jgi:hypothetical protein